MKRILFLHTSNDFNAFSNEINFYSPTETSESPTDYSLKLSENYDQLVFHSNITGKSSELDLVNRGQTRFGIRFTLIKSQTKLEKTTGVLNQDTTIASNQLVDYHNISDYLQLQVSYHLGDASNCNGVRGFKSEVWNDTAIYTLINALNFKVYDYIRLSQNNPILRSIKLRIQDTKFNEVVIIKTGKPTHGSLDISKELNYYYAGISPKILSNGTNLTSRDYDGVKCTLETRSSLEINQGSIKLFNIFFKDSLFSFGDSLVYRGDPEKPLIISKTPRYKLYKNLSTGLSEVTSEVETNYILKDSGHYLLFSSLIQPTGEKLIPYRFTVV